MLVRPSLRPETDRKGIEHIANIINGKRAIATPSAPGNRSGDPQIISLAFVGEIFPGAVAMQELQDAFVAGSVFA